MKSHQPVIVIADRIDNQSVNLRIEQRFDIGPLQCGLIVGIADQQLHIARSAFFLDPFDQQGTERVAHIRYAHTDHMADRSLETLGHFVRTVSKLFDDTLDFRFGLFRHVTEFAMQIP